QLEAFSDQALADILDRLHAAVEGLSDLGIRPVQSIHIRLEQDLSATKLLRRSFEILDDLLTDTTLFRRQPNHVLLVHGTLLVPGSIPETPTMTNPNSYP